MEKVVSSSEGLLERSAGRGGDALLDDELLIDAAAGAAAEDLGEQVERLGFAVLARV